MREQLKHNRIEWGFVALLVALCAVLTMLQYRWTGEVSRAEAGRLRAGVGEQAQQFCNAFDSALTESCNALAPGDENLSGGTREAVHLRHFQKWKSLNPRPLFHRVAIAVSAQGGVQLFEQSQATGKLSPLAWPPEWRVLWQKLEGNASGRSVGPFENSTGTLIEFPIFGGSSGSEGPPRSGNGPPEDDGPPSDSGPPGENEWMIFELDTNYLGNLWLPELARTYLNSGDQPLNDIVVKTIAAPNAVIFSSSTAAAKNSEMPVTVRFNRQGRDSQNIRAPGAGFRWALEVRSRPGALEAIVSASRRKNLAVAVALNGLILAAGFALVRHTRRSRRLAEQQMNFVANVSHELRTPLTVIRGAAHNIKRGVVTERSQIERYSELIIQHAEQLGEMVEQVLELAGAKKNHSAALLQPVALADVLNEAVAATTHDVEAAHCKVELELPPSLPALTGDAAALRRVFQNLITNAAKHGAQGGWIGITAVSDEDGRDPAVEIQVADRGPGIPPDELSEIFKPFFRGALAQALQIRGSGLGLSLVKEIIEAHDGSISARSASGRGTIFTVRLPVTEKGKTK